jgi:hypothetical protein
VTAFRAGNGKFVSKDNPIAVIGRLNKLRAELRQADALAARENELTSRRRTAMRNGYAGPLTRAELARMTADAS